MTMSIQSSRKVYLLSSYLLILLLVVACSVPTPTDTGTVSAADGAAEEPNEAKHEADEEHDEHSQETHGDEIHHQHTVLPKFEPANLGDGERLQVVASTSIIADVVAQVGGDRIALTGLIPIGADSHSFEATPRDLIALNNAHVIFINDLHLEEALDPILDSLDGGNPIVPVNIGVETMNFGQGSYAQHPYGDEGGEEHDEDEEHSNEEVHAHKGVDPHTWFSVHSVEQWVMNVAHVLSDLDPANANLFEANVQAYLADLEALEEDLDGMIAKLPAEKRILVTDHEVLGYFAAEYGFEVVGTVLPSLSTVATPSAGDLAALQDQIEAEGISAIFVGNSANEGLAQQLANDMGVQVVTIYTESLSKADGPAASYLDFMRHNMATIVNALK